MRATYKTRAHKSTPNFPSISPAETHDLETSHQGLFIFKITARKDLAFLHRQISPEDFIATFWQFYFTKPFSAAEATNLYYAFIVR